MSREFVSSLDISESHRVSVLVEVLAAGEVQEELTGTDSVVLDGSVSIDAAAASRGRLSLSVAGEESLIPTSPTDLLAPYGNELRVARGIRVGDDEQLVYLGVYRIARATVSGDQIQVDGLDRSSRYIDATFETDGAIASGTLAVDAILGLLQAVDPTLDYNAGDFASTLVALPALVYSAGEDLWAFCQGVATSLGGELYHDDVGQLRLRPVPTAISGDPVATIAEGAGGVLLGIERDWDREPVYNKVIVTGENPENSDPLPRGEATDTNENSPTYYYGEFGKKPKFYSNSFISTNTQAADAAAGILARVTGAPDSFSFESIVDPARRPSDVVRITRAKLGIDEDHLLDSVTIPLSYSGSMSARTRATQVL